MIFRRVACAWGTGANPESARERDIGIGELIALADFAARNASRLVAGPLGWIRCDGNGWNKVEFL